MRLIVTNPVKRAGRNSVRDSARLHRRIDLASVDDAEAISVWIDEDDEVLVAAVLPFVAGRAEREQALDLPRPIVGVEVEMDSADLAKRWWLLDAIERDVRSSAGRVAQNDPAILGRLSLDVTERRRPEREHLLEPSAADDDRADPDLLSRCVRRLGAHARTP
jgi:hypothetical protein